MEGDIVTDFFRYTNNFRKISDVKSEMKIGNNHTRNVKYTIAIPTYNRPDLLIQAFSSACKQDFEGEFEVLIVDNSDNNQTLDILKEHTCENLYYYKNEENLGMFGNWNRCIELSKGEYLTILNDDDILSRNYLSVCEKYLNSGVDGLVFKTNKRFEGSFSEKKKSENNWVIKKLLRIFSRKSNRMTLFDFFLGNKSSGTLGVLLRKEYLKDLGGYNPDYFPSSDYVLHANYCFRFNLYLINEKLNYYRVAENESAKQETLQKWEYIDNEIRKYFIPLIGKNMKLLVRLNSLIQDNRVKGLIDNWNYQTETKIEYKLKHRILQKLVGLKYYLNI